jgi:pullulanase
MIKMKTIILCIIVFAKTLAGVNLFVQDKINVSEYRDRSQELDKYYSDKKLGSFIEDGKTYFRIFAPSAIQVNLCLFSQPQDKRCEEIEMSRDENGVWEIPINRNLEGKFYGYKVFHNEKEISNPDQPVCIDPYSKALATKTTYMNPRRSIVMKDEKYDWEGTSWIKQDWRDLIIYEMHVRDITAHKSSGAKNPGTYKGLTENKITGGINYIKSLGVNTVEILPSQEYGYCEIPFRDSMAGKFNTWNPYERNFWGYMTGAFFAPAAYYSEDWKKFKWNKWIGANAKQVTDFKDMVKSFHKNGIAVIMDVVYNHLSEYEIGNLKQIDREYYFRLDNQGNYIAQSWCGNDLKTERPMLRRLIIESILYWMTEYHVDGFRFDLSTLIDWQTIEEIIREAKKINPNVVLIGEAWGGGGYSPDGFSHRGWAAWNDQIRNGIKGENPIDGRGWIFGKWQGNNSQRRIKSYVNGTLVNDEFGLFQRKEHSVNYLESHDGYTLGDFIRIGSQEIGAKQIISNLDKHVKLSEDQMKLNKLAALFLLTSQGMAMIAEGQEFARSKVIYNQLGVHDTSKGKMDHNAYNKDNETNYINYKHAKINKELVDYYKGLIEIRKTFAAFRRADYNEIAFFGHQDSLGLAYLVKYQDESFVVVFNADQERKLEFPLPPHGVWEVIADKNSAGIKPLHEITDKIKLEPVTGAILKLK